MFLIFCHNHHKERELFRNDGAEAVPSVPLRMTSFVKPSEGTLQRRGFIVEPTAYSKQGRSSDIPFEVEGDRTRKRERELVHGNPTRNW